MGRSHHPLSAGLQRRHRLSLIERLEQRQLLSATAFSGDWTGTYQLDAQSTASPTDPQYTGSGTIDVQLTNGVGTATLSGLTGASVTVQNGSTETDTTTVTVTSNSGQAVIADTGTATGVTGTFSATGQIEFTTVITDPDGPPVTSDTTNAEPLAFPFTGGTFVNGVISGSFEAAYQSGHFSLTKVGGGGGGGSGSSVPTKTLAPALFKKAVALAEATPGLDYGGTTGAEKAAVLIQKHEGTVLFVYPDKHGNPTVGVGFNLNLALNPGAQSTIDGLFGVGTYDDMMDSFQRTKDQWLADHHDSLNGFEYGSDQWKAFFKKYGGTTDASQNLASGSDTGDILTNVLTAPNPATGDEGTSAQLFQTVLPGYIANASSLVGASVFNDLDPSAQAALVDIVYNRGFTNTQNEFSQLITDLQDGDDIAAAEAIFDAQLTKGGQLWATLSAVQKLRAIDDFRYIVDGIENQLPQPTVK